MKTRLHKDDGPDVQCESIHETARFCARINYNCLKIWIEYDEQDVDNVGQPENRPWKSPFIDLVAYTLYGGQVIEVKPREIEAIQARNWTKANDTRYIEYPEYYFFPLALNYFAGLAVFGPNEIITRTRYDLSKCVTPTWNHRLDRGQGKQIQDNFGSSKMNCCKLSQKLPFRQYSGIISNSKHSLSPDLIEIVRTRSNSTVRCGNHFAPSCALCGDRGNCNGNCEWNLRYQQCSVNGSQNRNEKKTTPYEVSKVKIVLPNPSNGTQESSGGGELHEVLTTDQKSALSAEAQIVGKGVSCGAHDAPVCAQCGGKKRCHGECSWLDGDSICASITSTGVASEKPK